MVELGVRAQGLLICFLAQLTIAASAQAQTQQQLDWCSNRNNPTPDQRAEACTAAIHSGRYTGVNLAIVFNNRCWAHIDRQDLEKALADCNEAIRINPQEPHAYYNRGNIYLRRNELDRAISEYDQAIRVDPRKAWAYANRGLAYERKGEKERAIADFRQAYALGDAQAADDLRRLGVTP